MLKNSDRKMWHFFSFEHRKGIHLGWDGAICPVSTVCHFMWELKRCTKPTGAREAQKQKNHCQKNAFFTYWL